MNRFIYYILRGITLLLARLPLAAAFLLSDMVYLFVYHIVRYRRKTGEKNLKNAFPDKTKAERKAIEKKFYRHFCDYFFETIKLLHISDKEMKKRMVFKDVEIIDRFLEKKRPVVLMLGHYGNWEWVTSMTLWMQATNTVVGQIYRPLKNKSFDRFFLNLRKRFHSTCFPKNDIYRKIIKMRRTKQNWVLGFISDQKPSGNSLHCWVNFLNQDTPVIMGPERIAKQTNAMVCYLDITQVKRGYYEGKVKLISDNPSENPEFEIAGNYMKQLERTILRDPSLWLWTHNRWKFKRETLR